jgi:hypothetical protein
MEWGEKTRGDAPLHYSITPPLNHFPSPGCVAGRCSNRPHISPP